MEQYVGTGRRKTSVARVFVRPGSGSVTINGRKAEEYFHRLENIIVARQPLDVSNHSPDFDVLVRVKGGGESGQAGAIRHALARALVKYDGELLPILRRAGLLTRDPRMVERKKYGQRGARRKFQFSKR